MHPLSDSIARRLSTVYPDREARALARHILEMRFGITRTDLLSGQARTLSVEERHELENIVNRLLQKEPVQYILGQAEFCGHLFHVAPGVLIPRPETEELVQWIVHDHAANSPARLLDIGTGSGCIAVTLALNWPDAQITATDISDDALAIAQENAQQNKATVCFRQHDILTGQPIGRTEDRWDIIVSNPPYIRESEREEMEHNVLDHEPRQALFVPDSRPLLFYESIGRYAVHALRRGGCLYVEINRAFGPDTVRLFYSMGFRTVELRKDLYGNDRMIKCHL